MMMRCAEQIKKIPIKNQADLAFTYRGACEALCNMQICRNMLKRHIENEREAENGNQT